MNALAQIQIVKVGDIVRVQGAGLSAVVLGFRQGLARFPVVGWSANAFAAIALEEVIEIMGSVFDLPWPEGVGCMSAPLRLEVGDIIRVHDPALAEEDGVDCGFLVGECCEHGTAHIATPGKIGTYKTHQLLARMGNVFDLPGGPGQKLQTEGGVQ